MNILGTTSLFLDLYEGSPRGQRQMSRKHIQVIVSPDLNNSEEVLINRRAMIALMILPPNWPYNRRKSDFNRCMMSKEDAHRVMAVLQKEEASARAEALLLEEDCEESPGEGEFQGYASKREYTEDRLYSLTGDVSDIQSMSSFPDKIQDIIHQFEDTFGCKLNEGRRMKTEPVKIKLVEGAERPWKCSKARPTPAH